jgi:hypothetical protein
VVWSVTVAIETDDPELKRQILASIDAWRRLCDSVSVRTREALADGDQGRTIIHETNSVSFRLAAVENSTGQDEE